MPKPGAEGERKARRQSRRSPFCGAPKPSRMSSHPRGSRPSSPSAPIARDLVNDSGWPRASDAHLGGDAGARTSPKPCEGRRRRQETREWQELRRRQETARAAPLPEKSEAKHAPSASSPPGTQQPCRPQRLGGHERASVDAQRWLKRGAARRANNARGAPPARSSSSSEAARTDTRRRARDVLERERRRRGKAHDGERAGANDGIASSADVQS